MDKYVVIGHPIAHSLSPEIHLDFARQVDQEIQYTKLEAPVDTFESVISDFIKRGGCGANITLPFKTRAFQMASEKSQAAIDAMAANTIVVKPDGTLLADNTDGVGLIEDLTHNHHYCLRQKSICIIGAGGAVQGILGALLEQAPDHVVIANRTKSKAIALAERFALKGDVRAKGLEELGIKPFDLVIHGTSAGVSGQLPELPAALITDKSWCYDLVYGQGSNTPFVDWALEQGAGNVLDGLGMLVEQAAASFYLWRGIYPDTQPVLKDLRDAFSK